MLLGENGILRNAEYAKNKYDIAQQNEQEQLQETKNIMDIYATRTDQFKESLILGDIILNILETNGEYVKVSLTSTDTSNIRGYGFLVNNELIKASENNEMTIPNLKCNTNYNIVGYALDKNNRIKWSNIKQVKTLEHNYVYKSGAEFAINKGWNSAVVQGSPSFPKESEAIVVNASPSSAAGYKYTVNDIDFSNYSKIGIKWTINRSYEGGHFTIIAGDYNVEGGNEGTFLDENHFCYTDRPSVDPDLNKDVTQTLEFDIGALTKTGKIYVYAYCGTINISEIYLEK